MVTVEDINVALKTTLDSIGSKLPGGGWSGSGPESPAYPYAMFAARVRDTLYSSGPLMTEWWRATIRAYAPIGQETSYSPGEILQAVIAVTCLPTCALFSQVFRRATDKVLHVLPAGSEDEPSDVAFNSRDVLILTVNVEMMVQSDRSAA